MLDIFFFFSSRRRHTRYWRDWSSDVCSSDLQVWLMMGIATCVELFCSVVWGLYRYRWGNVPLFVPPGHGLLYLFALRTARTPLMANHGGTVGRVALACATVWAIGGLTGGPLITGRGDAPGDRESTRL